MEEIRSSEANARTAVCEMEPEGLLQCLQDTDPYREPDESSRYHHRFFKIHSNIILPGTPRSPKRSVSSNICVNFSSSNAYYIPRQLEIPGTRFCSTLSPVKLVYCSCMQSLILVSMRDPVRILTALPSD
jgi:hypothetical protein